MTLAENGRPISPDWVGPGILCQGWVDEAGTAPKPSWSRAGKIVIESGQGAFPEAGIHEARPRALLPGSGQGALRGAGGAGAGGAIPTGSAANSSIRSGRRPRVPRGSRWYLSAFPREGADEVVPRDAARSPGSRTSPASSRTRIRSAPRIWSTRTSCGWISIRCRASSGRRSARWRRWSRRHCGLRPHRLAQDVGLTRHTRQRAHRTALELR